VTVDHEPLAAKDLGLSTVGQVLSHLQRENRLVVQVLIDGEKPGFDQMGRVRQTVLEGHTIFIETADPRQLAVAVLEEMAGQIAQSDSCRLEAAELLQQNQPARALEKLGGCIRVWQDAQEAMVKTAELLRLDLAAIVSEGRPLAAMLEEFSGQLRQIKSALEQRDYVSLGDVLLYEMEAYSGQWVGAIGAMRGMVESIR
jgi:hypothetical protein